MESTTLADLEGFLKDADYEIFKEFSSFLFRPG